MNALRFALRFVAVSSAIIATLWAIGAIFALSRWAGISVVALVVILLYLSTPRWIWWLPGLLVFGVINALVGLLTHHVPTNPQAPVSVGAAGLLLVFYATGCVISKYLDGARMSTVERLAILAYLFCVILPVFGPNSLAYVTPALAWSVGIGVMAMITAFASQRSRHRRKTMRILA